MRNGSDRVRTIAACSILRLEERQEVENQRMAGAMSSYPALTLDLMDDLKYFPKNIEALSEGYHGKMFSSGPLGRSTCRVEEYVDVRMRADWQRKLSQRGC